MPNGLILLSALLPLVAQAVDIDTLKMAGRCERFVPEHCGPLADLVEAGETGIGVGTTALAHELPAVRTVARRFLTLEGLPAPETRALAVSAALEGIADDRRGEALMVLGELAQPAAEGLLADVLTGPKSLARNRIYAAAGLANFRSDRARAALEQGLISDIPRLEETAAASLGRHLPAAGPALARRALAEMAPWFVRVAAARALVQGKDPHSAGVLALLLAVPNGSVRTVAAEGVATLGFKWALPALLPLLADIDSAPSAARALGALGDQRAVLALAGALVPGAPKPLGLAALWAIGDLRGVAAIPSVAAWLTHEDLALARAAAEAVGRIGVPEALTALLAATDRDDPELRRTLTWAIQASRGEAPAPAREAQVPEKDEAP